MSEVAELKQRQARAPVETPPQPHASEGPRIYDLFPPLIGPVERWFDHLPRIARMGFNWVLVSDPKEAPRGLGEGLEPLTVLGERPFLRVAHQHPVEAHAGDTRQMVKPALDRTDERREEIVDSRAFGGTRLRRGLDRRPFLPLLQLRDFAHGAPRLPPGL